MRKRKGQKLPGVLYRRMLYLLKDYDRISDNAVNGMGDVQISAQKTKHAIDTAMMTVPEEYRNAILRKLVRDEAYPTTADRSTFLRWQAKLISELALNMNEI